MNIRRETLTTLGISFLVIILLSAGVYYIGTSIQPSDQTNTTANVNSAGAGLGLKRFVSVNDFTQYLTAANRQSNISTNTLFFAEAADSAPVTTDASGATRATAERVSQTNVQVAGIDEPDVVKTDGERIFYSPGEQFFAFDFRGAAEELLRTAPSFAQATQMINALPSDQPSVAGTVPNSGKLLLAENRLLVFSYDAVRSFDVTDPAAPVAGWDMAYGEQTSFVTARLINTTLYLVTSTYVNTSEPCPIIPLSANKESLTIPCTDIFHPISPTPVDVTYTIFAIDALEGTVRQQLALTGLSSQSVISVAPETLYLTYTYTNDWVTDYIELLLEDASDMLPATVLAKLGRLHGYDLSAGARMTELSTILSEHVSTLTSAEQENFSEQLSSSIAAGLQTRIRQWERTGIIAVDLARLQVKANGEVPGHPLNQFALDEHASTLRIATTSSARFGLPFGDSGDTTNDLYILDADLSPVGSLLGLGHEGETIHGVRFIEDRAYLVTFRQTDPFYVLDLADPENPQSTGELQLPGYSSYLHQIAPDRIIGIGQDAFQVKATLFDVSDSGSPRELSTLLLDDSWSEALNNHHAFLHDDAHDIVFLPGSQGGYILGYASDRLELRKKVEGFDVQRALYINDALYIVGTSELRVFDENTWEQIASLQLASTVIQEEPQQTEPAPDASGSSSEPNNGT